MGRYDLNRDNRMKNMNRDNMNRQPTIGKTGDFFGWGENFRRIDLGFVSIHILISWSAHPKINYKFDLPPKITPFYFLKNNGFPF